MVRQRLPLAISSCAFAATLGALAPVAAAAPAASLPAQQASLACAWPAWAAFEAGFLRADGRVLDPSSPQAQTVSEGQSYALFFALVQNDRATFERILRWTQDNLAAGDLSLRLPGWQWGRRADGSFGVLDENSAADADLWLAYTLGEAGRLWQDRRYRALASLLADRILREETAVVPGLGPSLLPGAHGFAPAQGQWRFNPSYTPPFLMRWFAARSADARWAGMQASALRVLRESASAGFAPDWAYYREPTAAAALPPAAQRVGGYDAIRVYLWVGMTAAADPQRAALLQQLAPMAERTERDGAPPQTVDAGTGAAQGAGPVGFSAALLPFLTALGRPAALAAQEARLRAQPPAADAYYDQVLALFGTGWRERRFAFAADGSLLPAWQPCPVPAR